MLFKVKLVFIFSMLDIFPLFKYKILKHVYSTDLLSDLFAQKTKYFRNAITSKL